MELKEIIQLVKDNWPFDEKNYPRISELLGGADLKFFSIQIVLHDIQKATRLLVTTYEPADHGVPLDENALRDDVRSLLISILRLASIIGVSAEDLEESLMRWAMEKHKS